MNNQAEKKGALTLASDTEQAKAVAEVQALFTVAQTVTRNMGTVKEGILNACQDRDFCEIAFYGYKRGKKFVTGPSIHLIEEIKSNFGRIKSGWKILENDYVNNRSHVHAYAMDIQELNIEDIYFWVSHSRESGETTQNLDSERDIYEKVANYATRRKRTCIERILPDSLVRMAVNEVKKTLNSDSTPLPQRIAVVFKYFNDVFGISKERVLAHLETPEAGIEAHQLIYLKGVVNTLKNNKSAILKLFPLVESEIEDADILEEPAKEQAKASEPPKEEKKKEEKEEAKPANKRGRKSNKEKEASAAEAKAESTKEPEKELEGLSNAAEELDKEEDETAESEDFEEGDTIDFQFGD